MKVAIVGAGAMGSVFGFLLARAGHEVVLINRRRDHVEAINRQGLEMEEGGAVHRIAVKATTEAAEAGPADLVMVFVKAYDTVEAARSAKLIADTHSLVLTLQNGLGNAEVIAAAVGRERTVCGVTAHGATLLGPGRVSHRGSGETLMGPIEGDVSGEISAVADAFNSAGIATRTTTDALGAIWGKLVVNAGINPLTAITRLRNGALLEHPGTRDLMVAAVSEAAEVAARKGMSLPYHDPVEHCFQVARATGANVSSMLQDVLRRRRTEIDHINGAVVREGAAMGVPALVNQLLTRLVQTIEASYEAAVG